ncbi:E3 ubiquitin-protein ligase Mdm2 isoform X1 [Pygocentrus nattereri]|uniref:E3 ubiquitin-protein ligase Mdm2 n=1 Tax=Pygocentrus nattereri TaxID=42514 RepID=A0A3B4DMH6_PYGNA|nr:E3 ubiquitin-protein ligase Mdm2 isoform X1 [Pygocentrus nattereri]XP_017563092.1 E3 ubiquitin-protein ligase Mdm2 isoform X1 [Pygocentrus nattereri]XP_017563093.1 E3 ubiquitin-protein ligase Mdm2 isoform X1 [Pygocentrus nattereri]
MATESCLSSCQINKIDNEKLVRPKVQLQTLLKDAGADKDVFTMKEVMFYLGKYIMSKELYDKQQQHIVHCGNDALGAVLGVASFSVKEPRALFAMISKNLIAVKNPESQSTFSEPRSRTEPDRGPEGINSDSSTSVQQQQQQQRRRRRSSDPSSFSVEDESSEPRKRHKSDSFSLTFDDSLSWCVIGGLRRERESSDSSDSCSNSDVGVSHSENSDESEENSDSDNFSVEFEVESIDSDAYSENDDDSVPGEDEVYEVTIFAEDEDSFDEDPEITEEDYWRCSECDKLNPPLPRHCKSCWKVRPDWLPEINSSLEHPSNDTETSAAADGTCLSTNLSSASECKPLPSKPSSPTHDPDEGMDVPDGKCSRSPATSRDELTAANAAATSISDSQGSSLSSSQPSTSSLQVAHSQEETPELERFNSLEASLPTTCLEPCVICQSRPKNGCIVHGRTGHLMACYTCAKKLKNRNKLCPVCREPIQSVVLTYVS